MRINDNYIISEVAGSKVLIPANITAAIENDGSPAVETVRLSSSAEWLLEHLRGKDFTEADAVRAITTQYDIDEATAATDVRKALATLVRCGVVK